LRNAIERIFGVLKRKFKILKTAPEFSIDVQEDLVLALTGLHNFARLRDGSHVDDSSEEVLHDNIDLDIPPELELTQVQSNKVMDGFGDDGSKMGRSSFARNSWSAHLAT
jgi:hypothetical protein